MKELFITVEDIERQKQELEKMEKEWEKDIIIIDMVEPDEDKG